MEMSEAELDELNAPEPRNELVMRLLCEATAPSMCNFSVSDALLFRRQAYGLSQHAFALVLGMQASHYSEVEGGKRPLPLNATRRAFAIGVPADVLLQPRRS